MSNQNEYPLPKDSYVAFDAISLRNHILKRLDEQGTFTDHNYLGSNLASVIDIVSFTYNTLIYYLHKTSNESMFSEAQLYENVNRIVKALDYKPVGFQTSTLSFSISANGIQAGFYAIPKYAYTLVGDVAYSFNEDISFVVKNSNVLNDLTDISNKKLLYQGFYKESNLFVSTGQESEVFTIENNLKSIDHNSLDVYVFEEMRGRWFQYTEVPTLYSQAPTARVYEKRLNPNKQYEINFGNNINGRKLSIGDKAICYYLESQGDAGVVGPRELTNASSLFIFTTPTFEVIKNDTNLENLQYVTPEQFSNFLLDNQVGATASVEIEDIEEIKRKAPGIYRSQYRLVTKTDYENYVQTNFSQFIKDARVFDNWEYNSLYLKYFNDIQVKPTAFKQIVFNQIQYADSCNFNNIYLCLLPRTSQSSSFKYLLPSQKEIILSNLQIVKNITAEVSFIDPIYKAVGFGVNTIGTLGITQADLSSLEIIKTPRNNRNNNSIVQEVVQIFQKYFSVNNAKLGGSFAYTNILSDILSIQGVSSLRTKRSDTNEVFEGLSFLMWNPNYPELDFIQISNNRESNPFELIYFSDLGNIQSKISVVDK